MTSEMTMNRVIHAAVRRDLGRLESALESAREGDRERAAELRRAYANLHRELKHHHESEDRWVFPMMSRYVDQEILDAMDTEHQAMADALADTDAAMERYAASGSAVDAAAARDSVSRTREVVARHLDHEEQEFEPALAPHLESPEWKQVEKRFRSQPLGDAGRFMAWVQDGMEPQTRAYLRSTVPPPVLFVLGRVVGRSYHRDIAPVWAH
jgi:hemerythrin-like domain-containing protein